MRTREKELIKNAGILICAKMLTQIITFAFLPLYTKVLSTAEYGQVDIYNALSIIIISIISLEIGQGIFRFLLESDETGKRENISSAFIIVICNSIIGIGIFIGLNHIISVQYFGMLIVFFASALLYSVALQVCRGFGKNILYAYMSCLNSVIVIISNFYFVFFEGYGVRGILFSSILANVISCVFIFFKLKLHNYFSIIYIRKSRIKRLIDYSCPLVFNQLSSWIINYSDRIIILKYLGVDSNGIFSVASKFSNLIISFFNVVMMAWTENIILNNKDADYNIYLNDMAHALSKIYLCVLSACLNFLTLFFGFLVDNKFQKAYFHIPILLMGMLFSGLSALLGSVYIAHKKSKEVSVTTIISGCVNIIVHIFLIRYIGLYAASISTLIAFIVMFIIRHIYIFRFQKITVLDKKGILEVSMFGISILTYCLYKKELAVILMIVNIFLGFQCVRKEIIREKHCKNNSNN